ncbi:hypothetical protein [Nocardia sp. NPDC056000]|uniref:hypothetical protein n=1 Tax=Nocardia sp. NPDC056000 TaxID=3345674 RepID=UPI0035DBB463
MTTHRIPHRTVQVTAIALTAISIASAVGCGRSTPAEPPPHTLSQFCAPLLQYFDRDLKLENVKLTTLGIADKKGLNDSTTSENCSFSGSSGTVNGSAWINRLSDNAKLTNSPQWFKDQGYKPLPGHSADIWINDSRTITQPIQKKGTLDLITQVGVWQGHIEIVDDAGPLAITDEQVGKAADAIIAATTAVDR